MKRRNTTKTEVLKILLLAFLMLVWGAGTGVALEAEKMLPIHPVPDFKTGENALEPAFHGRGFIQAIYIGEMVIGDVRLKILNETAYYHADGAPAFYSDFKVGKGIVLRTGSDACILSTGNLLFSALEASELVAREGYTVGLISMHTVKPLDTETLVRSASKTGRVLIVHEAPVTGGVGAELAATIAASEAFDYLDAPIRRLAGRNVPIPYNRTLEAAAVPQVEDIVTAARALALEGR